MRSVLNERDSSLIFLPPPTSYKSTIKTMETNHFSVRHFERGEGSEDEVGGYWDLRCYLRLYRYCFHYRESVFPNVRSEQCNNLSYFHSFWCVFALQNARSNNKIRSRQILHEEIFINKTNNLFSKGLLPLSFDFGLTLPSEK